MGTSSIEPGRAIKVFFLGSGNLGIPVLDALVNSDEIELSGVGSQPDRPAGRNRIPSPAPLAAHAESLGFEVCKPSSINNAAFIDELRRLRPELVVVVAFGQILRPPLLELPEFGCFNVHASLLPRYRGASPVTAAILSGDEETGVSFMRLDQGMDTGPVYRSVQVAIPATATAGDLESALARLAAEHVVQTICEVCKNGLEPVPQNDTAATYAGRLSKKDGVIDWNTPATVVERMVRAYNPWPRATCFMQKRKGLRRLQITGAQVIETPPDLTAKKPGEVLVVDRQNMIVACGEDALKIERVIPEGSREMNTPEFLRGATIANGVELLGAESTQVQQHFF